MTNDKPIVADLFCGCSGLGLGTRAAGFEVATSVDIDAVLTSSHRYNHRDGRLLLADVATMSGAHLTEVSGGRLDGIVGGPPCQGFSEVGKADPNDPRRELLDHFFRIVAEARPRFFLMENVRGLLFEKNRPVLDAALGRVADRYEIVGPIRLDAADYGAATSRPRVFVFGYDRADVDRFDENDILAVRSPRATVRDAIADLAFAHPDGEDDGFDAWRFRNDCPKVSDYARRLWSPDGCLTSHRRTPHKPEIVERFAAVREGGMDSVGRHPRLSWSKQCPTLRAGTGSERGSFQAVRPLHPEEPRVITVREAARLQGFPDRFRFHSTIWHSFRMIGNSVSPIAAEALLSVVRAKMAEAPLLQAAE